MGQRAAMIEQTINGQVIDACRNGDREAFRVLFEAYKDKVYSIAVYSLGDHSIADDVTQQIFLKLFTAVRQFRGDSEFTTWLYRLVVNACIDERRKRRRFLSWGDAAIVDRPDNRRLQERSLAHGELSVAVQNAVSELKPKFRLPIMLKYVEGLSYEEIADVMGCSKGTVASRLNRGHSQLARKLGQYKDQSAWSD